MLPDRNDPIVAGAGSVLRYRRNAEGGRPSIEQG
jgi:hypothetical protein